MNMKKLGENATDILDSVENKIFAIMQPKSPYSSTKRNTGPVIITKKYVCATVLPGNYL